MCFVYTNSDIQKEEDWKVDSSLTWVYVENKSI